MTDRIVFAALSAIAVSIAVAGCGDDVRPDGDAGSADGAIVCSADGDCDDGFACTLDSCGVGGFCRYEGIDERCEAGLVCAVGRGCVDEASCGSDEECDDGFTCTIDRCGVGGICAFSPVNERCEGPGASCDPATGAALSGCTEATGCTMDGECDDGQDCTLDSCGVDNTCDFAPVNERCPDGQTCTASGCFEPMDCTTPAECDDGNFCNGAEVCDPEFGCQPAPEPRMCADVDDCTIDSCDPVANACRFACDSTRPECECPMAETPCDGIFDITPVPTQTCAAFIPPAQVEYAVSEVEFNCVGSVLSVDARNVPNPRGNSPLTQSPRPTDDAFAVETVIAGGCTETYRLEGRFIDADTFEGTFSAGYVDTGAGFECGISGCVAQGIAVTGTRR